MKILKTLSKRGLALFLVLTMCLSLLPATAMAAELAEAHPDAGTYCGLPAHTHTDECYENRLVCGLEEFQGHTHGGGCYSAASVQVCTLYEAEDKWVRLDAGTVAASCKDPYDPEHIHSASCFLPLVVELVCEVSDPEHIHDPSCFAQLVKGHRHDASCYEEKDEWVRLDAGTVAASCEDPYDPEHIHSASCFLPLVVELRCEASDPEHIHDPSCFVQLVKGHRQGAGVLTCGLMETAGHTHGYTCYKYVLVCGLAEHTHDDSCYVKPGEDEADTEEPQIPVSVQAFLEKVDTVRAEVAALSMLDQLTEGALEAADAYVAEAEAAQAGLSEDEWSRDDVQEALTLLAEAKAALEALCADKDGEVPAPVQAFLEKVDAVRAEVAALSMLDQLTEGALEAADAYVAEAEAAQAELSEDEWSRDDVQEALTLLAEAKAALEALCADKDGEVPAPVQAFLDAVQEAVEAVNALPDPVGAEAGDELYAEDEPYFAYDSSFENNGGFTDIWSGGESHSEDSVYAEYGDVVEFEPEDDSYLDGDFIDANEAGDGEFTPAIDPDLYEEELERAGELISAAWDAYDELLGTEYEKREDVREAAYALADAMDKLDALLGLGLTTFAVTVNTQAALQSAIDSASSGDVIALGKSITLTSPLKVIGKTVIITGTQDNKYSLKRADSFTSGSMIVVGSDAKKGNLTLRYITVNGNNVKTASGRMITLENGTLTLNNGATLTKSYNGKASSSGGAVSVNSGTFTMNAGSSITNNTAVSSGGAVNVQSGAKFVMEGGTISGNKITVANSSINGGAVRVAGTFTMNGGTITGNTANTSVSAGYASSGGAVYVYAGGKFTMTGGTISSNVAPNNGGGVYLGAVGDTGTASFSMSGGTITGNTAKTGGGVYCAAGSTFTMSGNAVISGNRGTDSTGGVVVGQKTVDNPDGTRTRTNGATFTMSGGTISGNAAGTDADAVGTSHWAGGVWVTEAGTFTMSGGTVSGNQAKSNGGGVHNDGTFNMSGGSITGNYAGSHGGGVESDGTTTMTGGVIGGSAAAANTSGYFGGGVNLGRDNDGKSGKFFLRGTAEISYNSVQNGHGGGVSVSFGSDSAGDATFYMQGGTVKNNTASGNGGGVYLRLVSSRIEMSAGTIENNSSVNGGGVYNDVGIATISGGIIRSNTASNNGGGVYASSENGTTISGTAQITGNGALNGGGIYADGTKTVVNGGSVTNNTARACGGGMYIAPTGDVTMTGGTISGNTSTTPGGGVYQSGIYRVSGAPIVQGNKHGVNDGNIFLPKVNGTCKTVYVVGTLSANAVLRVYTEETVNTPIPVGQPVGYVITEADRAKFISDNTAYFVRLHDASPYNGYVVLDKDAYTVEYYLQDVTGDGYTLQADATESFAYNTSLIGQTVNAEEKSFTGFRLNAGAPGTVTSGTISGTTPLTLKLYYDREVYDIDVEVVNGTAVAGTQNGAKFTAKIRYGGEQTLRFNPNADCVFESMEVSDNNDPSLTSDSSYSFSNVTENKRIKVVYRELKAEFTLTVKTVKETVNGTEISTKSESLYVNQPYHYTVDDKGTVTIIGTGFGTNTYPAKISVGRDNYVYVSTTTDGTAAKGSTVTITLVYALDNWRDGDSSEDGDVDGGDSIEDGDGIPDKYQALVQYSSRGNGDVLPENPQIFTSPEYTGDNTAPIPNSWAVKLGGRAYDDDWVFDHWTADAGTHKDQTLTARYLWDLPEADWLKAEGGHEYTYIAYFVPIYTLTVSYVDGSNPANTLKDAYTKDMKQGTAYDVAAQITDTLDANGHHYVKESVSEATSGTATGNVTITVVYTLDNIGGDPDPEKTPDGIPDKYQAIVTYVSAGNGSVSISSEVFTSEEYKGDNTVSIGSWNVTPNGKPVANVSGYAFAYWTDKAGTKTYTEQLGSLTVNGGQTYTYTAHFLPDEKGSPNGGDGIPDAWQAFVIYQSGDYGTVTNVTEAGGAKKVNDYSLVYDLRQYENGQLKVKADGTPDLKTSITTGAATATPNRSSGNVTYSFSSWTYNVGGSKTVLTSPANLAQRLISNVTGNSTYIYVASFSRNTNTTTTIREPQPPTGDTEIDDPSIPLASAPGLNSTDHFAYVIGYEDGTVRPTANITRAEVATIFFRLMTDEFRSQNWATSNSFSDVNVGNWYNNAVSTAAKAGLVNGYPDGSFKPGNKITRAEFAAIAARFLSDEEITAAPFADTVGHWAEKDITRAVQAGWIQGYPDGTFRPNAYITRAEVMTVVNRMLDRVPDKDHLLPDMIVWPDNPETAWYYEDVQEATNGHDYERDDMGIMEIWTALEPVRDWAALESAWATANS